MTSTGDMKNNVKQLQTELKAVKYPGTLAVDGLVSGCPKTYLAIYHYLFTSYNTKLTKDISNGNNELYGKSDMRFMEAMYKVLRDVFQHKPHITREQFFSSGFAERKVIMATEILRLVRARYKPPKSSARFKVTATKDHKASSPVEKVDKEPSAPSTATAPHFPRKIAARSVPDVSGAIVLPARAASASNGFRIPRSAVPQPRHVTLAESGRAQPGWTGQGVDSESDHDETLEETEMSSRGSVGHVTSLIGQAGLEAEIRRKVVDVISPAVISLSERVGKMEISLKSVPQQQPAKPPAEVQQFQALTTGLTKQMSDFIFKLDTLTSRVVLIENRLTMVEAKVEARGRPQGGATAGHVEVVDVEDGDEDESSAVSVSRDRTGVLVVREGTEVKPNTADPRLASAGAHMNFMKTLIDNNDSALHARDDSCVDAADDRWAATVDRPLSEPLPEHSDTADHQVALGLGQSDRLTKQGGPEARVSSLTNTFGHLVSPIRPSAFQRVDVLPQDDSVISIPCGTQYDDGGDDRRASTPSHATLDMSTLDRVTRISQMMAETQQLFG